MTQMVLIMRDTMERSVSLCSVDWKRSALAACLLASSALIAVPQAPAHAQSTGSLLADKLTTNPNSEMLVEADELVYDYDNDTVSAVGNVQIYYDGRKLFARKVTFNRKTARVVAEGGVRLVNPDGHVLTAKRADISEDFSEGFINSLNIETPEKTRFAAESAERRGDNETIFNKGVYTACKACEKNPKRAPLWQVKATKIIHNQKEKMITYRNARLEFFGIPVAYIPYFSTPDPTVKRKTGLLAPNYVYAKSLGFGLRLPYFINIAPNMDVTLAPTFLHKQGVLASAEFRHRLSSGTYQITAHGIRQLKRKEFANSPGDRDWRGAIQTHGKFHLNSRWFWGWDLTKASDKTFLRDYKIDSSKYLSNRIYLTGIGKRSYFHARLQETEVMRNDTTDTKRKQALVHPVIDYNYVFGKSVIGGELGFDANVTSITRSQQDVQTLNGVSAYRGLDGTYSRASLDVHWRRKLIGFGGIVLTPFAALRGDIYSFDTTTTGVTPTSFRKQKDTGFKGMATAGLDLRYPWMTSHDWGTQTFTPVAQIIARPNEIKAGNLPNEDSHYLNFEDSILFDPNKYGGYDRTEGGVRANVGFQYRANFKNGGYINAMIGQSYHIAGKNSYAVTDLTNSSVASGLETDRSDFVASLYFSPRPGITAGARARFDSKTFVVQRVEGFARASYGRVSGTLNYVNIRSQPRLGYLKNREQVGGSLSIKLTENWKVFGAAQYDTQAKTLISDSIGIAYDDECFSYSLSYNETRSRGSALVDDRSINFRINLRTLGGIDGSQSTF